MWREQSASSCYPSTVSRNFSNLRDEVLEHRGHVDGGARADVLGVLPLLHQLPELVRIERQSRFLLTHLPVGFLLHIPWSRLGQSGLVLLADDIGVAGSRIRIQ